MNSATRAVSQQLEEDEPVATLRRKERGLFWKYIFLFFAIWSLRATVLYGIDLMIPSDSWRLVYSNVIKFMIWVLPAFTFLIYEKQSTPFRFLKLSTRVERRGLLIATVVTAAFFTIVVLGESFMRRKSPAALLAASPSYLLWMLVATSVSPLLEEIMFRGFVLGKLAEWKPFWRANVISSILFSFAHWPHWLWTKVPMLTFSRNAANAMILGLLFGWIVKKTDSLWPAVVAHIVNNCLASLIGRW